MTMQVQAVLKTLVEEPGQERYGLDLCGAVGLPSGTVYPILARLEKAGWVTSRWEDQPGGRPRRRYYLITGEGARQARAAVARTYASRRQPVPGWALP